MMIAGTPVRENTTYGVIVRLWSASDGHRWWLVDWDTGMTTVADESVLTNVEREEWADALDGVPAADRCPSVGRYGRRCGMRKGHRTRHHRECEISWTDETAVGL